MEILLTNRVGLFPTAEFSAFVYFRQNLVISGTMTDTIHVLVPSVKLLALRVHSVFHFSELE
jgi:hypothetical protein